MNHAGIELQPLEWSEAAEASQIRAASAYLRLIKLSEEGKSGQCRIVSQFIASTFDGSTYPFDLSDLQRVDIAISKDMLTCLDALRWGKTELYQLVPDGNERVQAICDAFDLNWPLLE